MQKPQKSKNITTSAMPALLDNVIGMPAYDYYKHVCITNIPYTVLLGYRLQGYKGQNLILIFLVFEYMLTVRKCLGLKGTNRISEKFKSLVAREYCIYGI